MQSAPEEMNVQPMLTSMPATGEDRLPEDRHRVLIVGGGVGALETLLGLHELAEDFVDLTLLSPEPEFTYKPLLVEEPFALGPAERHELGPLANEAGARLVAGALARVEPDRQAVELDDGSEIGYDSLVICTGGCLRPAFLGAITFPRTDGPLRVDELLEGGYGTTRIAFVIPPGVTWALPMYELALMTERRGRETGHTVECVVVTPESAPLVMFGTAVSDSVSQLLAARGIAVQTGAYVREFDPEVLTLCPADDELQADSVVALPLIEGPRIPGLPCDEVGFIAIDEHCRVAVTGDVYAAGDCTNFPIKQGGLATQQADAAAEHIARRAGAPVDPNPFRPVLRGTLLTGADSLQMRHDVAGGGGEGRASADYLWWPPHKIASRYLSAWLEHEAPHSVLEPPRSPLDVEVAMPKEWHEDPMALDPYAPLDVEWNPRGKTVR